MSGRCACHRNVGTCTWRTIDGRMTGEFAGDRHHVTCDACGRWLPLGPSDETPERVAIEIRAAELAFNGGPIRTCDNSMPEDCEGCGWDCWPLVDAMHDAAPAQWAGYLARAIVKHDDKETPIPGAGRK